MMRKPPSYTCKARQGGFSLVEVMIASLIGLLILMGVVMVYLSGSSTAATTEALSRVQESGRFATHILERDIRSAGFKSACQQEVNILLDESDSAYSDLLYDLDTPLTGWDDAAGDFAGSIPDYIRGDVLLLKTAVALPLTAADNTDPQSDTMNLTTASGLDTSTVVFVGTSLGCDMFQNSAGEADTTLERKNATLTPGNKTPASNPFSQQYDENVRIFQFVTTIYYIGQGIDGRPALKRVRYESGAAGNPEELVNGIDDMQLLYGEDTNNDDSADAYRAAGAVTEWEDVVSVRFNLLAASLAANVTETAQALPAPWNALAPGDGRLRRVFSSTAGIRNMLSGTRKMQP